MNFKSMHLADFNYVLNRYYTDAIGSHIGIENGQINQDKVTQIDVSG